MKLYSAQKKALDRLCSELETNDKVILAHYTGGGKTNIFIEFIRKKLKENPGARFFISSYLTTEIREQIGNRVYSLGLGKYSQTLTADHDVDSTKNIIVSLPHTIYKRELSIKFDYFIVDEGHIGTLHDMTMINQIISKYSKKTSKVLYATATPWDLLACKGMEDVPVIHRSLHEGIKDKSASDFKVYLEATDFEYSDDDFTRDGELKPSAHRGDLDKVTSLCLGILKNIIKKYDSKLGKKVVVICPYGGRSAVARKLAKEIGGISFIGSFGGGRFQQEAQTENLHRFLNDPEERFLFVVRKCSIGFDYDQLSSIVDLSFTRNVTQLCQRVGRLSRGYKGVVKNYFYCFDKSLTSKVDVLWFLVTSFIMGDYRGFTTRTAKYTPLPAPKSQHVIHAQLFSDIVGYFKKASSVKNHDVITFAGHKQPSMRSLSSALNEARQYKNRHDLFKKNPSLYKWFRTRGLLEELNKVHPRLNEPRRWNLERAIEAMKSSKTRREFHRKHAHCRAWLRKNGHGHLMDKYLPENRTKPKWSEEIAMREVLKLKTWGELRHRGGLRRFLTTKGIYKQARQEFLQQLKGARERDKSV